MTKIPGIFFQAQGRYVTLSGGSVITAWVCSCRLLCFLQAAGALSAACQAGCQWLFQPESAGVRVEASPVGIRSLWVSCLALSREAVTHLSWLLFFSVPECGRRCCCHTGAEARGRVWLRGQSFITEQFTSLKHIQSMLLTIFLQLSLVG